MESFNVGGREFKVSKLDAFKQFHVARRIGPILADILPSVKGMQDVKGLEQMTEDQKLDKIAAFAAPIMNGLSKLSDKDAEFVLLGLLSGVEMKQATGGWAYVARGELMMVQDLELPMLFQLAGRSFVHNLSGFFAALPRS